MRLQIDKLIYDEENLSSEIPSSETDITIGDGISIQSVITLTTPVAKNFSPSDVNTTDNTITETAHGYATGLLGQFSTSGGLPAGLSAATDYFVIVVDANTYKVATSLANALAGTAVDITTQGTGTHTFTPTALAGGSTWLEVSNNPDELGWVIDTDSVTAITGSDEVFWRYDRPLFKYVRQSATVTAGQLEFTSRLCVFSSFTV